MAAKLIDEANRLISAGQAPLAIALIRKGVSSGDPEAAFQLAVWHLVGAPVPRDLEAARALLSQAFQPGHSDAAQMYVALLANGTFVDSDWTGALRCLEQTASRGNQIAAEHLGLLRVMRIDSQGQPMMLAPPEIVGRNPTVRKWRALLTPEECAHLATSVLDLLEPSMVADPRTGRQIAHPVRKSSAAVIGPTRESLPVQAIQRRIASVTGTDVRQGEPIAVLHYAPGQQYLPHMDTLPNEQNQRITTVLVYLNTGYSGGETHFPASGLKVAGSLGDVIAFDNVLPDGSPDPGSRHAGLPVQRGTKWLATRWIRRAALDVWAPRR